MKIKIGKIETDGYTIDIEDEGELEYKVNKDELFITQSVFLDQVFVARSEEELHQMVVEYIKSMCSYFFFDKEYKILSPELVDLKNRLSRHIKIKNEI